MWKNIVKIDQHNFNTVVNLIILILNYLFHKPSFTIKIFLETSLKPVLFFCNAISKDQLNYKIIVFSPLINEWLHKGTMCQMDNHT